VVIGLIIGRYGQSRYLSAGGAAPEVEVVQWSRRKYPSMRMDRHA